MSGCSNAHSSFNIDSFVSLSYVVFFIAVMRSMASCVSAVAGGGGGGRTLLLNHFDKLAIHVDSVVKNELSAPLDAFLFADDCRFATSESAVFAYRPEPVVEEPWVLLSSSFGIVYGFFGFDPRFLKSVILYNFWCYCVCIRISLWFSSRARFQKLHLPILITVRGIFQVIHEP
eukprot:m.1036620 g.1036620  ORF g.1036620 m.1036620 type:complete len:174 (+) comp24139_c2_seq33:3907-4428(+)